MDRPHGTHSSTSTTTRNAGAAGPTNRARRSGGYRDVETAYPDDDVHDYDTYDDSLTDGSYEDDSYDPDDPYDDVYEYEDSIDRRWIWVAGVAGAILLVAVVCTVVILGGGDSGSVSKTVAPPIPTTAPSAVITTAPPVMTSAAPPPPPIAPLSPETVTTVAPSPTAVAPPAPAPIAAPTDVAPVSPRTITYQVTGSRPLLDMVTVVYTDAQGALQTEFNVALPWTRTVTLDPGVELKSVIATSLTGQLNCSVTDPSGRRWWSRTTTR